MGDEVSKVGRPSQYTPKIVKAAWEYVNGGWITAGDKVPSVAGLACEIGVHRETLRLWAADEDNEFFGILREIAQRQERELVNNGLTGDFVAPITKMMLTKHGYSDRVEQDHTSSDGSMSPQKPVDLSNAPQEVLDWIVAQKLDDANNA
jgi:hypothetical protein